MCGFCASFDGQPHWSDTAPSRVESDLTARRARVALLDRIARHYSCRVEDWAGAQYIVRSLSGRTEIVSAIPDVWRVIEQIAGRKPDPLAADLLQALKV